MREMRASARQNKGPFRGPCNTSESHRVFCCLHGTCPDDLPSWCRFRKLHPFDSRSLANQNMITGCSLLPSFLSACCATVSSRDDGLKPKFWCYGISSTSCSSARHIGYV